MNEEERYGAQKQQRPFWKTARDDDLAAVTDGSLEIALIDNGNSALRFIGPDYDT